VSVKEAEFSRGRREESGKRGDGKREECNGIGIEYVQNG